MDPITICVVVCGAAMAFVLVSAIPTAWRIMGWAHRAYFLVCVAFVFAIVNAALVNGFDWGRSPAVAAWREASRTACVFMLLAFSASSLWIRSRPHLPRGGGDDASCGS